MNKADFTRIRDDIITAALPHIPFDGWTPETLARAAQESGHNETAVRAVFPGVMTDALDHFADLADRKMLEALSDTIPEDLRIRDRVKTALMARYRFLTPHREALRQSLQFWILPTRKPRAVKIVWRTADRIWNWAGDTATDYNRTTKRSLLCGIIISATLYWMNSKNTANEHSLDNLEAFIDRRIENVLQFGKIIGRFKGKATS